LAPRQNSVGSPSILFQEHLDSNTDESGELLREAIVAFELPRQSDRSFLLPPAFQQLRGNAWINGAEACCNALEVSSSVNRFAVAGVFEI